MSVNDVISEEQLPAWMIQAKRGVDWGALLVIGFCLIAAWSFISESQLPATNDTEAYVFRSADYAAAFSEGIFYNRWSPHALNGYGAPIPHFYPPGATYIAGLITYLFTNDAILSVRILYVFSFILAGSTTYTLIAQRTTSLAGIMGATLYVFSPFFMLNVPHIDGDLPLIMGMALLPSLLWSVNRILVRNQAIDILLICLVTAATILTLPIIFLQALFAVFTLLLIDFVENKRWNTILTVVTSIICGVVLAAFYWLPALLEINAVNWFENPIASYRYSLSWSILLAPTLPLDSAPLINMPIYNLGWGTLIASTASIIIMAIWRQRVTFSFGFLALGIGTLAILVTLAPKLTEWLALVTLCLAISGSYIGQISNSKGLRGLIKPLVVLCIVIVSSFPMWMIPSSAVVVKESDATAQNNYELSGFGIAGVPYGQPIPSNMTPIYAFSSPIADTYDEGMSRINESSIATTLLQETTFTGSYSINADEGGEIIYERAYFNGWQARSPSQQFEVNPSSENLIAIQLPSNVQANNIIIRLGVTPQRAMIWVASLMTFVIVLWQWWYRWRTLPSDYDRSVLLTQSQLVILTIILAVFFLLRLFISEIPDNNFTHRPARYTLQSALYVRTDFDDSFQLLAYEVPQQIYQAGDDLRFTAFWQLNSFVESPYLVRLRLVNTPEQETIVSSDLLHAGYYPTNRWQLRRPVPQIIDLALPENLSDGSYALLFDVHICPLPCIASAEENSIESDGEIRILRPIVIE